MVGTEPFKAAIAVTWRLKLDLTVNTEYRLTAFEIVAIATVIPAA